MKLFNKIKLQCFKNGPSICNKIISHLPNCIKLFNENKIDCLELINYSNALLGKRHSNLYSDFFIILEKIRYEANNFKDKSKVLMCPISKLGQIVRCFTDGKRSYYVFKWSCYNSNQPHKYVAVCYFYSLGEKLIVLDTTPLLIYNCPCLVKYTTIRNREIFSVSSEIFNLCDFSTLCYTPYGLTEVVNVSGTTSILLKRCLGSGSYFLGETLGWCTEVYTAGNTKRWWKSFELRNLISKSIRAGCVVSDSAKGYEVRKVTHCRSKKYGTERKNLRFLINEFSGRSFWCEEP